MSLLDRCLTLPLLRRSSLQRKGRLSEARLQRRRSFPGPAPLPPVSDRPDQPTPNTASATAAQKRLRRRTLATIEEGKPLVSVADFGGSGGMRRRHSAGPRGTNAIRLRRQPGVPNLGIGLAGGADKDCPPIVSCIRAGSIADRSDGLQVGDLLVGVNGIRVAALRHEEILTLLRNAGQEVTLALEYSLQDAHFARAPGTRCSTADVRLRRGEGEEEGGFGFTLRGGSYGPDPNKNRPLTITNIRPGGPADREGRLRVGDRILCIESVDVGSATLHSASQLIAKTASSLTLTIEYDVSILETIGRARGPVLLEIEKPGGVELGLRLATRPIAPHRRRLFIRHILPASIADRCGALGEGDELLSVDGVGLECATLAEAAQLLKGTDSHGLINLHILPHHQVLNRASSVPRSVETTEEAPRPRNGKPPTAYPPRSAAKSSMRRKLQNSSSQERGSFKGGKRHPWSRDRSAGAVVEPPAELERSRDARLRASAPDLHDSRQPRLSLPPEMWKEEHNRRLVHRTSYPSRSRPPIKSSLTASVSGVPCGQVCHSEVMEVVLHSWAKGGFGLILHRSPVAAGAAPAPLFVSYIERGSPAERSGVLQVGDRVLAIGDWPTAGAVPEEANQRLRHSSSPLALTVEFDVIETVLPSHGVFTVKLAKRGQNNLGIVIRESGGGGGKGEPVFVSEIRTGSVAHRCGSIQPGDSLLAIDNIPVSTCTVEEAARLLARSSDIVKLRVRKNSSGQDENESSTVVYSVELSRRGGPLGITIASTDEKGDPVLISQLAPGGLADRTAALHVGDRILAINGETLAGKRVSEAMGLLQSSADTVVLKIARCIPPPGPSFAHAHPRGYASTSCRSPYERDGLNHRGKTGTPVQSIDSAVESLEDSPIDQGNHRHSKVSNDSSSKYGEELSVELQRSLTTLSRQGVGRPEGSLGGPSTGSDHGGDSGLGSSEVGHGDPFCGCTCQHLSPGAPLSPDEVAQKNWIKVLEALETVGEEEMLAKLEESILSGAVPGPHASHCPLSAATATASKAPTSGQGSPCGLLAHPFPSTNTILRHPGMGPRRSPREPNLSESSNSLSSGDSGLPPPKPPHSSQLLNSMDSIPFITSPQPPPPILSGSTTPSSIQLSSTGTITPSLDGLPPPPAALVFDMPGGAANVPAPGPLDIFRVALFKDHNSGDFGFSISDGASDSGVFINNIRVGGPADVSGAVRPFDRILQVNNQWVERLDCASTRPLLVSSTDRVVLLLARDPRTPRPDSIAEEDESQHSPEPPRTLRSPLQTQL